MKTDGKPAAQDWCYYCHHMIERGAESEWYHFSEDDFKDTWTDDEGCLRRTPYGCNCVYTSAPCRPATAADRSVYSGYRLKLHLGKGRAYLTSTASGTTVTSTMAGYSVDSVIIDEAGRFGSIS